MFQGSFKDVLWKCQGYLKKVSRVFKESVKCVSRKLGALRKISGCFKEVSRMLQENFKGVSKKIEGCFKAFSKTF